MIALPLIGWMHTGIIKMIWIRTEAYCKLHFFRGGNGFFLILHRQRNLPLFFEIIVADSSVAESEPRFFFKLEPELI